MPIGGKLHPGSVSYKALNSNTEMKLLIEAIQSANTLYLSINFLNFYWHKTQCPGGSFGLANSFLILLMLII